MDPTALLRTVYLGDRACKSITIDGWAKTMKITVDCISRIRSDSGNWDYYTDEDIVDGILVFGGVRDLFLQNEGCLPNDEIDISISGVENDATSLEIAIGSADDSGRVHKVLMKFRCESAWIEDPRKPGVPVDSAA